MTRFPFAAFVALLVASTVRADDPPLNGLDPIELIAGKEVPGDSTITATAGRFTYRFATPANRATFLADPQKYGIQFGGACMKMGPLSGYGSPTRWHVHAGRIYLFASDGCRTAFRADPVKFIDAPDAVPPATPATTQAAAGLMGKAVAAVGGDKRLRAMTTYQVRTKLTQTLRDGKPFVCHRTFVASFPDATTAEWEEYDQTKYGWVWSPKVGYRTGKTWEPVDDQVRGMMSREAVRDPLVLLKAWQTGTATAVATGPTTVAVALNGATRTLDIDPADGRIRSVSYRGRASAGLSAVERQFSDFREVNGLIVSFQATTTIDGKPSTGTKAEIEWIKIDEAIPAELVRKP